MSAIKSKRQAATIRIGLERGKHDALVIEKTGGWWGPYGYLVLGSSRAGVTVDGKQKFYNFELFGAAWEHSFEKTFESRFSGLSDEERSERHSEIMQEHSIRCGRVEKLDLTFDDGHVATAYRKVW